MKLHAVEVAQDYRYAEEGKVWGVDLAQDFVCRSFLALKYYLLQLSTQLRAVLAALSRSKMLLAAILLQAHQITILVTLRLSYR